MLLYARLRQTVWKKKPGKEGMCKSCYLHRFFGNLSVLENIFDLGPRKCAYFPNKRASKRGQSSMALNVLLLLRLFTFEGAGAFDSLGLMGLDALRSHSSCTALSKSK